jgi:predicted metal-dependent peptidase
MTVMGPPAKLSEKEFAALLTRLKSARVQLLMRSNWFAFGNLSMHLKPVPVEGLGTCATDGESFLYDPVVLAKENVDWLIFDWAHEVLHLFGMDLTRKPADDIQVTLQPGGSPVWLWNLACDLWINLKLEEEKFTVPTHVPVDRSFAGWSKDQIYAELRKRVKDPKGGGLPKNHGCGGFIKNPNGKSDAEGTPTSMKGKEFSKWTPDQSEIDKWTARAKEAVDSAKARGTAPGFMESAIKKLLEPRHNWRDILWQFVQRSGREWRYTPPSRTGAARGMILPRLVPQDEVEHGVFWFDTSGSIGDHDLKEFLTELDSILKTVKMRATVMMVDADVHSVYEFGPFEFDAGRLRFLGRGGTAFEPAFEKVEEMGLTPTFGLYFTDSYGSFPQEPPSYPVLWALTVPPNHKHAIPWGQVMHLREETI